MARAIDLYSGIGGWTLGLKLAGIKNAASFEWWPEANQTHNINFGTNHHEVNIRNIAPEKDLCFEEKIDFVVGSPPCTQFSFANKGGNGDIQDGLVDIHKFLEIVDHLNPKYWAMENVPRVAKILEYEIANGSLTKFRHLVKCIQVVDSADYGVPQNRKRMIAGNFPFELFSEYKRSIKPITLGQVLKSLENKSIEDPNYGYKIERSKITELENEADLTPQELRINKDVKTFHPIYNQMSFPDKLDRPSRTVTATCTRVSRESIIVKSRNGFRRLNVRERGVLQGFPITYQFYGKSLNSKFKMIGNAVPPVLTYYIFQSMLEVPVNQVKPPRDSNYYHEQPKFKAHKSNLGLPARKYPSKRRFQYAVPNLRFGSGVRFELSNNPKGQSIPWSFKFFYGNSKNIKEIKLNTRTKSLLAPIVNTTKNQVFNSKLDAIVDKYDQFDSSSMQKTWISNDSNTLIFDFLDEIGDSIEEILSKAELANISNEIIEKIIDGQNRKLLDNKEKVLAGLYFLSSLNCKILE